MGTYLSGSGSFFTGGIISLGSGFGTARHDSWHDSGHDQWSQRFQKKTGIPDPFLWSYRITEELLEVGLWLLNDRGWERG